MSDNTDRMEMEREDGDFLTLSDAVRLGSLLEFLKRAAFHNYPIVDPSSEKLYIARTMREAESTLTEANTESAILPDISRYRRNLESTYIVDSDNEDSPSLQGNNKGSVGTEGGDEENPIVISDSDGSELSNAAESWLEILKSELENEVRLPVSSDGLIDIVNAMEDPSTLFHDGSMWESLPDQTQNDLTEACQTVAIGCSTASVFLSLRAVEERLGEWYSAETGNDIEDRTFGQVLSELDDSCSEDSRPPLLSHLNYLRDRRNQVAHPDESPDEQEAVSTLIMVRETISNIQHILAETD